MKRNRRRRISDQSGSKSVQLLGLALFIMLLAFFIVLNALSTFEENKVNPILGSLENTFSSAQSEIAQKRPSIRPSDTEEEFKGDGDTTSISRISDLFRGRIARVEIVENKDRGIMMISVPYADFSTAIIALGQSENNSVDAASVPFLPTLVSLLQSAENGQLYRMDMILNSAADPLAMRRLKPQSFQVTRDKVGRLSRRLESAGIPAQQMSIGLKEGRENILDLVFTPHEPFDVSKVINIDALNDEPEEQAQEEGL